MPQHEPFLVYGVTPETREFMLVVGRYNFEVVKGFKQPVVALLREWQAEYGNRFPFAHADRVEFVISRVAPTSTATYAPTREMQQAAEASANFENNLEVLKSIAADPQIRQKCVMSNGGVFDIAQARFRSRDNWPLRQRYRERFQRCPHAEHVRILDDFCCPPEQAFSGDLLQSSPTAKNPYEWDMLSEDDKARILFAHQDEWLNRSTPAITATRSEVGIVLPEISTGSDNDWKGAPTREQLESIRSAGL